LTRASKEKIINDEIKVLEILEQHAKESIGEIAKKCGFSHQKVWRVIKDLETKKIIWGYTAVTDETVKKLKHFTLLVKRSNLQFEDDIRKEVSDDKLDNLISGFVKIENIYTTNGTTDFVFTFYAPDLVTAKKFVNQLFKRHANFILEFSLLETMVQLRKYGLKNPKIKELVEYI